MRELYVFGNEYLAQDSMARRVAAHLHDVDIRHCRSPDDLLDAGDTITILDVAQDTDRVRTLTDVSALKTRNLVSLHDFDLAYFLNLLEAIGNHKNILIIAVPATGEPERLARDVERCMPRPKGPSS